MSLFLDKDRYDNRKIKKMLEEASYPDGYRPSKELIDQIVKEFWFYDYYINLISDKVFFGYLYQYLEENKVTSFHRPDFYNYFYRKILSEHFYKLELELNLGYLQKVALIFEKLQTDTLNLDKYDKYIKKTYGDYHIFSSEWLRQNKLALIVSDEKDPNQKNIKWAHHSLTEYLTAEYILRQNNPFKTAERFMVLKQVGITAFKPSWTGVLSFLFESKKANKFKLWAIEFAKKYPDALDENFTKYLTAKPQETDGKLKTKIFDLIYKSYYKKLIWIPPFTRRALSLFIDQKQYQLLKNDIKKTKNEVETYVRRGNVASIIGGMLENGHPFLNTKEKLFWKKILIGFANDKNLNGVLQRDSLDALAHFKDEKIIPLVLNNFKSEDTLVKEAFVQFCYDSSPNSKQSIDYMIEAIKQGVSIYGRYGLYEVKEKKPIAYLLKKFSDDPDFFKLFIDKESIFNKEEGHGDAVLLKNIDNILDKEITISLKNIIKSAFKIHNIYFISRSTFLQKLALMIQKKDKNYLFEIINNIKNSGDKKQIRRLEYDYVEFLRFLLTPENVGEFVRQIGNITKQIYPAEHAIYLLKRESGEFGEKIYQSALKAGLRPVDEKLYIESSPETQESEQSKKIYLDFLNKLEPVPKKYFPDVFEYYIDNKEKIERKWKENDKKRLLKLAINEILEKVDPKKFKVNIKDKSTGNRQFTWTGLASYYGKVINIVNILASEKIKKYRQNIINFIPYAYSDDQSTILDVIKTIKDKELTWVNKVYLNKEDDRRYLETSSYIYVLGEYQKRGCKLKTPVETLKSFVSDSDIMDHEQRFALEQLVYFIDSKDKEIATFLFYFINKNNQTNQDRQLANISNSILITIFKDRKAINWRFNNIKKNVLRFERPKSGVFHEVNSIEEEISDMNYAKPLIHLNDIKYIPYFFDLLDYSFKQSKKNDELLQEYINYLWRIVIAFIDNLKIQGSFKPLILLEKHINKYKKQKNINWFFGRTNELKKSYVNYIGSNKKLKNL